MRQARAWRAEAPTRLANSAEKTGLTSADLALSQSFIMLFSPIPKSVLVDHHYCWVPSATTDLRAIGQTTTPLSGRSQPFLTPLFVPT